MRKIIPLALVALIGAVPATLDAQAATAEARINAAFERAHEAGIPAALLESKMAEGRAKGVPMERIAAAIEARSAGLQRAQDALTRAGVQPTRDDLSVGADAIGSGVSEVVLGEIASTAPAERRLVAVAVLTELVAAGHVPEQALAQVKAAMERGPEALANLPAQAAAARGQGGPPSQAGQGQAGQGRAGPPAGTPAPGQRPPAGRGGPPGGF